MANDRSYGEKSEAVHAHLSIAQSVIQRMASNSASSKAWCITLVSAMLVVVADKGKPDYAWIAVVPAVLFLVLDAYYLALEKGVRDSYNGFIDKLHRGEIQSSDLYAVNPSGPMLKQFFKSLASFSVWPFYLIMLAMIFLARNFVL